MQLVDQPNTTFTTSELSRLVAYRAAVAAGFYSDWDGSATCTDTQVLDSLFHANPFTPEQRERLEVMRARLAAGAYAEDQPKGPTSATTDDSAR